MFCDEALEAIEPIAAGDLTPDWRIAAHLATCANCARALEDARCVERMLSARQVPSPPAQFTTRTLARLRRDRWRAEQFVDAGFNLVLLVVAFAVLTAVWLVARRSGLNVVGRDAVSLLSTGLVALSRRVAPAVPLYAGATALVAVALGIWWWAERDTAL